jgi:uncharacterized protein (DUF362 family)
MVKELLRMIEIENELKKDYLIALKPNLINATNSANGATTDPELTRGIIEYLQEKGFANIIIMEGSWVGADTENAFDKCGYKEISEEYGVPLYNLQQASYTIKSFKGMEIEIADQALEVDYLINLPVLKGHCQTKITCALKNLKGCLSDQEKRRFHQRGLHKPIAYLNKLLKQDLIIVDGIYGDLDFEEGGNPIKMNRIIAAKDPVLLDGYAAGLLGYNTGDIEYIEIADQIGVGNKKFSKDNLVEINKDQAENIDHSSRKIKKLAEKINEKDACSACYGSLIYALKRIEEKGKLNKIEGEIKIGQGYKDEEIEGIGIGVCCSSAEAALLGCPPDAKDIIEFLEKEYEL